MKRKKRKGKKEATNDTKWKIYWNSVNPKKEEAEIFTYIKKLFFFIYLRNTISWPQSTLNTNVNQSV